MDLGNVSMGNDGYQFQKFLPTKNSILRLLLGIG